MHRRLALPPPQRLLPQPGHEHHGARRTGAPQRSSPQTGRRPPIPVGRPHEPSSPRGAWRRPGSPARPVRRSRRLHTCADIAPEPQPTRVDVERTCSRGGAGEGGHCRQERRRRACACPAGADVGGLRARVRSVATRPRGQPTDGWPPPEWKWVNDVSRGSSQGAGALEGRANSCRLGKGAERRTKTFLWRRCVWRRGLGLGRMGTLFVHGRSWEGGQTAARGPETCSARQTSPAGRRGGGDRGVLDSRRRCEYGAPSAEPCSRRGASREELRARVAILAAQIIARDPSPAGAVVGAFAVRGAIDGE